MVTQEIERTLLALFIGCLKITFSSSHLISQGKCLDAIHHITFHLQRCGNSEGDYVSLGYFEHFDIEDVISHVLENYDFIDTKKFL